MQRLSSYKDKLNVIFSYEKLWNRNIELIMQQMPQNREITWNRARTILKTYLYVTPR